MFFVALLLFLVRESDCQSDSNFQLENAYVQPEFSGLFDDIDVGREETLLQSGGVPLIIVGTNLDAAVSPMLTLTAAAGVQLINVTCTVVSPTKLSCMIPKLTTVNSGANLDYSLTFDGQILSSLSLIQPLRAVADPVFNASPPGSYAENSNLLFTISGSNLNNVRKADYNITIGGEPCPVFGITENSVACTPPQTRPGGRTTAPVIVTVGRRDGVLICNLEYTIDPIIIIVPTVVGGSMFVAVSLVTFIVTCMCWCYKSNKMKVEMRAIKLQERIEREQEMNLKKQEELEQQVENMASQVVVVHSQMKELVQGKGTPANYYSEVKDREYEDVKEVEEDEVLVMDGGETFTNPGVQKDKNNSEKCMDMSGNDTLPPPVVTSQEPPNQTIQQTQSDRECEVRTSDGEGSSQTADESQLYVNEDEDPSLNVHWPLTKNPAYGLPPVGILQSDHDQTADESQSYVNEDEDPSLNVHWPLTKNPAYGLPPVGILQGLTQGGN